MRDGMKHATWSVLFGLLLIVLGALLLLKRVLGLELDFGDVVAVAGALFLIVLGVYLLVRRRGPDVHERAMEKMFGNLDIGDPQIGPAGLDLGLLIGDMRIDVSRARFADVEHRLRAHTVIGDIRIIVPAGLPVRAEGHSLIGNLQLLGKTSDGFGNRLVYEAEGYAAARRKLSIHADLVLGDIKITRAEG